MNPLVNAYRSISTMNGWTWDNITQGVPTTEIYGGRVADASTGPARAEKNREAAQ
jgi:hypothetical protein